MSTLADRTIAALPTNHDELAARVREFHEQILARHSGSSQRDVAQVLSHLGSGAEIGLAKPSATSALSMPATDRRCPPLSRAEPLSLRRSVLGIGERT
jgi:hypothetical protein